MAGIILVPMVDGRCTYENSMMPDWVNHKFRDLLFRLLEFSNENERIFEESEYMRLCESLKTSVDRRSGIDSMKVLRDDRSSHNDEIIRMCHTEINPSMSSEEVALGINQIYGEFRRDLLSGELKRNFRVSNPGQLISEFTHLYEGNLYKDDLKEICKLAVRSCPLMRFINSSLKGSDKHRCRVSYVDNLLSMLNKVKSLKLLNTRRKQLLNLDVLMLSALIKFEKTDPLRSKDSNYWLGCCHVSVNDRLVSHQSTKNDFLKVLRNRQKSGPFRGVPLSIIFDNTLSGFISKVKKCLQLAGLNFMNYNLTENLSDECAIKFSDFFEFTRDNPPPTMHYEKVDCYNYDSMVSLENAAFQKLSSISLAITNSMKTSSVVRLRQNESGAQRYKSVECKEVFYQDVKTDSGDFYLLYQKTGEVSRCYSIHDHSSHIASFYADPKRFFLPIFSHDVILEMLDIMMSWLTPCSDLEGSIPSVHLALRTLVLLLLTNPSKRNQRQVQNLRYLTMALVSDFHHVELMDKLREDLITDAEKLVHQLMVYLVREVFLVEKKTLLTTRFKFMLNVSYLCHLITKETPDRLTDQIKCFEKFFEPKKDFGFFVNPKEVITDEEKDLLYKQMVKFTSKDLKCQSKTPGINKKAFSLMVSSINNGTLVCKGEKKLDLLDPMMNSGCATALDLASNKSVVVNKTLNGERLLEYDFNKLLVNSVSQITENFMRKGKLTLNAGDYEYKVSKAVSKLIISTSKGGGADKLETDDLKPDHIFDGQEELEFFHEVKDRVESIMLNYGVRKQTEYSDTHSKERKGLHHLQDVLPGEKAGLRKLILSEISYHLVEDFDPSCLSQDDLKYVCERTQTHNVLGKLYFTKEFKEQCTLDDMAPNLCRRFFEDGEWFSCFKMILLQMNANTYSGKYRFNHRQQLNFKFDRCKLEEDARISERESNSESLSKALSLSKCLSSALKNLCFYSEEAPTSYTSIGPDSGRLKFALSYKEQVGGNRELYIGDMRTKMFTRLIEDYFESLTGFFSGSCLNDEKEFENAILSMTINVRQGFLSYSMDHSKWGPMMCPFLFLMLLQNLKLSDEQYVRGGKDHISTLLAWHIHKMVEVPHNVVSAMMRSYIKDKLKLLKGSHCTPTERLFRNYFEKGVVPSHITSLIDMGQGILHNASDFYGLLSERFINYSISLLYGEAVDAYTSSDDQITLFDERISNLAEDDPEEVLILLEFHSHMSALLNKFVSPKSVVSRFAAEFKSRFYVWGEEVPLLTKFVSAALHNVKCKEPHQLCETIDTILDQAVANGVPVRLVNRIQSRTLSLLKYANCPIDPFMLNCQTDVKDWLDGSRGYRIQRLIETLCPSQTKVMRKLVRRLHHKLKNGELSEEFLVDLFNRDKPQVIEHLGKVLDLTEDLTGLGDLCWLNLNEQFPMRMVLRQKVIYPSSMNFNEERLPSLVKTLQNKLSSKFTRGAQKLLAEAINKSAFQSCISSGFIGLCKTLGSRCIRNKEKETLYIKKVVSELEKDARVSAELSKVHDITLYKLNKGNTTVPCPAIDSTCFLRPILWDYICITLSNSFELGVWVIADPSPPPEDGFMSSQMNLNDYVGRKPTGVRLLEDRVTLNHILQSVRRLFPKIYEDQLLPFMSDQSSKMMKWSPRIKFLDLCVLIDIHSECLSLISHIVKYKRDEHYVVLTSDLARCHSREDTSLKDEFVVSSSDVCRNFLKQVFFESFVREFVITSRTIGNFSWFPHKSMTPSDDGIELLGPFQTFVSKVVNKGFERPMYRTDLQHGFGWFSYQFSDIICALAQLVQIGLTETHLFNGMTEFWNYVIENTSGILQLNFSVNFTHNQSGGSCLRKFSISFQIKCQVTDVGQSRMLDCTYYFQGDVDRRLLDECLCLLRTDMMFKGNNVRLDLRSDEFQEYVKDPLSLGCIVELVITNSDAILKDVTSDDFQRVGPEWEPVPLSIKNGNLYEGCMLVQPLSLALGNKDFLIFLVETEGHPTQSVSLAALFKHRFKTGEHLMDVDIQLVLRDAQIAKHTLIDPLKEVTDWFRFRDTSLCYSKAKETIMYETSIGRFRLKGKSCDDWLVEAVQEEIE
ncbi:L protein [Lunk virus NKS-1]|uniref:RNA-directed RNA polymerase L n=1 Tax=Lunk virus NKS-1 TaxID=1134579 RepID=K0IW85_9VIRU|nr:L protein [Lunk virus NKS-1]BAM45331.1 L protein [Lunk virus NKS-1]